MNEWPFPTSLRGWSAVIGLVVIALLLYYLCIFPPLQEFYERYLYRSYTLYTSEKPELPGLEVRIDSPWYIASYGPRWLYITIKNQGKQPAQDVKLWVEIPLTQEPAPREVDGWVPPATERMLSFEEIPSYSSVSGHIPILAPQTGTQIFTGTLRINWSDKPLQDLGWEVNRLRFLAHSFVERVLLPPWSNISLIIVVCVVCAIVDRMEPYEEKEFGGVWKRIWWMSTLRVGILSLRFLLGVLAALLVLVTLPWWWSWPTGLAVIFLASMVVPWKPVGGRILLVILLVVTVVSLLIPIRGPAIFLVFAGSAFSLIKLLNWPKEEAVDRKFNKLVSEFMKKNESTRETVNVAQSEEVSPSERRT